MHTSFALFSQLSAQRFPFCNQIILDMKYLLTLLSNYQDKKIKGRKNGVKDGLVDA
jgi:hypothetical protein